MKYKIHTRKRDSLEVLEVNFVYDCPLIAELDSEVLKDLLLMNNLDVDVWVKEYDEAEI